MPKRVQNGQYELGEVEPDREKYPMKTIGVIQGKVANDERWEPFGSFIGLQKSKWFVYEEEELLVNYRTIRGTYVKNVANLVKMFDTKKAAVDYAERKYEV